MAEQRGAHFVRAVERAFLVLEAFTPETPELTLAEASRRSGLDRAGTRRLLLTLTDLGYLRHDGRHYTLAPRVLDLGHAYLSARSLPQLAEPHLQRLTEELGEMTAVGVLDGDDVRYVAAAASPKLLAVSIPVGSRFPAHAASMGKMLLAGLTPERLEARLAAMPLTPVTPQTAVTREALHAELAQIRRRGFAISDDQLERGLRGVAVPIVDAGGAATAAVSVSVDSRAASVEEASRAMVPPLLATASRISADLRLSPAADR